MAPIRPHRAVVAGGAAAAIVHAEFTPGRAYRAAAGKIGAVTGTCALTVLLPVLGLRWISGLVAGVSRRGLLVTISLLPEPRGTQPGAVTDRRLASLAAPGR